MLAQLLTGLSPKVFLVNMIILSNHLLNIKWVILYTVGLIFGLEINLVLLVRSRTWLNRSSSPQAAVARNTDVGADKLDYKHAKFHGTGKAID